MMLNFLGVKLNSSIGPLFLRMFEHSTPAHFQTILDRIDQFFITFGANEDSDKVSLLGDNSVMKFLVHDRDLDAFVLINHHLIILFTETGAMTVCDKLKVFAMIPNDVFALDNTLFNDMIIRLNQLYRLIGDIDHVNRLKVTSRAMLMSAFKEG